jgi:hypothetical protein
MAPSDHAMPRARGVPACRGVPWSIVVLAVVVVLQEAFGHLGPGYGVPEAGLARSAAWRVIGGTDAADRGGSPAWIASAGACLGADGFCGNSAFDPV